MSLQRRLAEVHRPSLAREAAPDGGRRRCCQDAAATPVGSAATGAVTPDTLLPDARAPGPPRRTEMAAAASRAWAASSGMRRGVSRKAGPQMSTAATTLPRASWTGAATALSPSSYSPIAVA